MPLLYTKKNLLIKKILILVFYFIIIFLMISFMVFTSKPYFFSISSTIYCNKAVLHLDIPLNVQNELYEKNYLLRFCCSINSYLQHCIFAIIHNGNESTGRHNQIKWRVYSGRPCE